MADEEGVAPQDGDGMGAADLTLPAKRELEINFDRIFRMLYSDLLEQSRRGRAEMPADSATLHADFRREWLEVESQVAGVFPEYADLRCGPGGEAWLQPFDPDEGVMGKGPDWLRITPNGERTEVQMPPNFVPYRFHEDRIWGMVRGEFDVPSVGWVATPG